jgi:cullin-4
MTHEQLRSDRLYLVEAAAIRIMKVHKTMTHDALVAEITSTLKFIVDPEDMNKRIEVLIERDFIERDPNNNELYNYVA